MRKGLLLASTLTLLASACFTGSDGLDPDRESLFFPTGLARSAAGRVLYVANSDFDLSYSGGSVVALDLSAIRQAIGPLANGLSSGQDAKTVCESAGLSVNPDPWLNPGPCDALALAPFVRASALTGAFASDLLLVNDATTNRARLFAPVRGDPSVTYFEVDDDRSLGADDTPAFKLDCNADENGFCGNSHRVGRDAENNLRGVQLPADPVSIAATADGAALVTAHQTQGAASLITQDFEARPELNYFASNLASGPTDLATIPPPAFVKAAAPLANEAGLGFHYDPGFALTYRESPEVSFLRYFPDTGAVPARPFIFRTDTFTINTNITGFDSRGISIVAHERQACEASCAEQFDCMVDCAERLPLDVYIANRTPPSVVVGRIKSTVYRVTLPGNSTPTVTGATETLELLDTLPLDFGPSRVASGTIINTEGQREPRVFVVCFDSRLVFIIDPTTRQTESVIRTGRGPHAVTVDEGTDSNGAPYAYLYVGHFTDSYIGVVDLNQAHGSNYGQMIASIGIPTAPRGSK